MTSYSARELSPVVGRALAAMPVVVVTGLRQAGKTTFLRQDPAVAGRRYLSLDDLAVLEAARRDPRSLVAGDGPLVIDEVQRCPELLLAVKQEVDRRRAPGRFLLSGSANLLLLGSVSESLAGRAVYLTLHPFTRRERLGRVAEKPVVLRLLDGEAPPSGTDLPTIDGDEVLTGGMPPPLLGEAPDRDLWFLGYEQTYLERDVRALAQVADLVAFRQVVQLAALRTGQLLNQSELARDAHLPAATVGRYLGLLETSFLITRLAPYLRNPTARLVKSPKLYLADSGLAAHLAGVRDLSPLAGDRMRGALIETFVAQNLAALLAAHRPGARLGFWNVQGRHEVDFVVEDGQRALAIEVKASTRFGDRDLAGLRAFLDKNPAAVAGILGYSGEETLPVGERLWAVPLPSLLG